MNKDEKTIIDVAADTEKADPQQSNSKPETVTGTISAPEEELQTLTEVIKEQATEDESPLSANFTLRKILGGDILNTSTIRHQIWLFLLIAFILLIYISNRYSCQQDLIEIDKLKRELQDARYKALSTSSQITEKSRESNVLNMLKDNKDSVLHIANQPPFIINVPEE
ncbi:MAG: FtsL-like putative cell division protein [Hoylesella enoeca]|uniref:FtsL-like putative cell division protein n=1 Tax=Hoylesella enoeca TaxID=76123 RepID=UPI003F9FC8CB